MVDDEANKEEEKSERKKGRGESKAEKTPAISLRREVKASPEVSRLWSYNVEGDDTNMNNATKVITRSTLDAEETINLEEDLGAKVVSSSWSPNICIRDSQRWTFLSRNLAINYTLTSSNVTEICRKNREAAEVERRPDLIQLWRVIENMTHPTVYNSYSGAGLASIRFAADELPGFNEFEIPWALHPMGRALARSLFKHYEKIGDSQTLAMIFCVLSFPELQIRKEEECLLRVSLFASPISDSLRQLIL